MKHIKESIIGRKGTTTWPNPYGLTQKDVKGQMKGWPLEIITLIIHEAMLARRGDFDINWLWDDGLMCAFTWENSKDGYAFWEKIDRGNFDVFYKTYTPAKLKKRLEE